jgi:hypothetical protein
MAIPGHEKRPRLGEVGRFKTKSTKAQRGLWPQSKGIKNAEAAEMQRSRFGRLKALSPSKGRSRHEIYAACGNF